MKNKICVIFTGGTIGSIADGATVNLSGGSKKMLLDLYENKYGKNITFTTLSPVDMLSENVQFEDLDALANCVKNLNLPDYDGIIITHGTDTLCFTANYFSQIFAGISVPLVFVSSLYPLNDKRSNGLDNFASAVAFIQRAKISGVFVSFKNEGERCKIHLGSRLIFSDQINGHYHSALREHFAEIDENFNVLYPVTPRNPTPEQVDCRKLDCVPAGLCEEVMLITARSLLNFAMYDFSRVKPKAVIVELYHSGTIGTKGKRLNFNNFAAYCEECGVPIVIAPVDSKAKVYASMANLPKNVIIAYDLTLEMTVVKVMSALAQDLPPQAYFDKNVFFEKIV